MISGPHDNPSDDTAAPDPMKYSKEVDNNTTLILVYIAVIGLTMVSVAVSSMGLGRFALPFQLIIGTIQAALVAYHFMHLKQGDRVVIMTALASIFWMGILFVLFMADYMTRTKIVGW